MGFVDLWKWEGKAGRRRYALVGLIGFAIKHNIDRLIAASFFKTSQRDVVGYWFNYWAPLGNAARLGHLSPTEAKFLTTMLVLSLPFIWIGMTMTLRRLRDAGQPLWLVTLFFVPFVNLPFFLTLCALPSRERAIESEAAPWPGVRPLDVIIPRSRLGSGVLAIVVTTAIGLVFSVFGATVIGAYGWSLFVALPFCLGLFSVLFYSYHAPRELGECMTVSLIPIGILGVALMAIAVEGVICLMMAAPLGLALSAFGGAIGYHLQARHWRTASPAMMCIALLAVPALFSAERAAGLPPPKYVVRSAIEINAPPETVWKQVVAFAEIPPPREILFRAGIAYPIRAEISGRGPGAIRRCVFSTGPFVEPIEVWDEPRLLRFGVLEVPTPLNELTPYGHIEPRHLHGYFVSERGQFQLTELPAGRTRLEGTTWYRDAIWPAAYWRAWSDYIIHRIHMRVLEHIKTETEESVGRSADGYRNAQSHRHFVDAQTKGNQELFAENFSRMYRLKLLWHLPS